jgi:hypothetical protein
MNFTNFQIQVVSVKFIVGNIWISHIVYKQVHSALEYIIPSGLSTADLMALDSQWKYTLHYNCIRIWIYWSESILLNLFLYKCSSLKKNFNLVIRIKFYWSWAGGLVLIVKTVVEMEMLNKIISHKDKNNLSIKRKCK